jgi:exopolysaccharide production protein ExoQ
MFKLPATIFCIGLIYWAFRLDRKLSSEMSIGLWIPTIWMMIIASRPISAWVSLPQSTTAGDVEAGDPIDRTIFSILIVLAIWCLFRRKLKWTDIFENNPWLMALIILAGVSILWSDYPLVSVKRWIRAAGTAAAALIVITEAHPFRAVQTILRRLTFLHLPISLLLIKYYDNFGIGYDEYGTKAICGITNNKNTLGRLCMVSLLYLIYALLNRTKQGEGKTKSHLSLLLLYLCFSVWLLLKANSATSLVCTLLGVMIIFIGSFMGISRRIATFIIFIGLPLFLILWFCGFGSSVVAGLGRDTSLTGRTDLWAELIDMRGNMLFGTGYGAFWIGKRLDVLWQRHWWMPNMAHNGYLEIYLELGVVGIVILAGFLCAAFKRIHKMLGMELPQASMFLAIFFIFLVYNITESATSLTSMMWFVFIIFFVDSGVTRMAVPSPLNVPLACNSQRLKSRHSHYNK